MCLEMEEPTKTLKESMTVYKVVDVKRYENIPTTYFSQFHPSMRGNVFAFGSIMGDRVEYKIGKTYKDKKYLGYYAYTSLEHALNVAAISKDLAVLKCEIPKRSWAVKGQHFVGVHGKGYKLTPRNYPAVRAQKLKILEEIRA